MEGVCWVVGNGLKGEEDELSLPEDASGYTIKGLN